MTCTSSHRGGEEIYFRNKRSRCRGELDVDRNANPNKLTSTPVENVHWPKGKSPPGVFTVWVNHYARHGARDPTPFTVKIKLRNGSTERFYGRISHGEPKEFVHRFVND